MWYMKINLIYIYTYILNVYFKLYKIFDRIT